jgi:hypothetical protein
LNPLRLINHQPGRPLGADSLDVFPADLPSSDSRLLATAATRNALSRWEETRKRVKELQDLDHEQSDPTNKWNVLAYDQVIDAEHALILAILAWDEGFKDWDIYFAVKQHRQPRGIVRDGIGYFVVPNPDRDECEKEDGIDVMKLVVVPMASVVDLDRASG